MNEQPNRSSVCSVLFLDIVEYSKRPVTEQMMLKQRFNALLGAALQRVAVGDRIVLDTGDGAAVSFIGDPEDALFAARSLRDAITAESASAAPALATRAGINLGPVRLIKDLNAQLTIIGDGIDVAQRVMNFAEPGQILVSRSYFEVVSRLSPERSQLFQYQGARTDEHVREHEVYAVGPTRNDLIRPGSALSTAATKRAAVRQDSRLQILLPMGIAVIIAAGVALRIHRQTPDPKPEPQVAMQEPSTAPAATRPAVPAPAATSKDPRATRSAQSRPQPKTAAPVERPTPAAELPLRPAGAPEQGPDKAAPLPTATLRLVIVPWGEVFVDGTSRGVSPPLREVSVSPGKHLVTVQNTSLAPYSEHVDVKPGEQLTIRHRFD